MNERIDRFLHTLEGLGIDTSPHTFKDRLESALNRRTAIDPRALVTVNGEEFRIEDLPSTALRECFGYGHRTWDVDHREHLTRPDGLTWPYTPLNCLVTGSGGPGVWIDAEHLVCPGCGLDFT